MGLSQIWGGGWRVDQGHCRCVAGCLQVEAGLDVPQVILAAVSVLLLLACVHGSLEANCLRFSNKFIGNGEG